jgi:hypothetical protein
MCRSIGVICDDTATCTTCFLDLEGRISTNPLTTWGLPLGHSGVSISLQLLQMVKYWILNDKFRNERMRTTL